MVYTLHAVAKHVGYILGELIDESQHHAPREMKSRMPNS